MNDPILLTEYLNNVSVADETTTIFPPSWKFSAVGNTLLKRKRKHSADITQETKLVDWFVFTCLIWGVKFNRERRAFYIKELMNGTQLEEIEKIIKQKKNDDQKG